MNACKYVSKWGPIIFSGKILGNSSKYFKCVDGVCTPEPSYWGWFTFQMITTLFCLYWDYVWDWGMFYGKKSRVLRDKMTFSPSFYWMAIVENTCFRFWWLFMSFHI